MEILCARFQGFIAVSQKDEGVKVPWTGCRDSMGAAEHKSCTRGWGA